MESTSSPKISIITPNYNQGHLLENLAPILRKQSLPPDEHIIIDDGSTDNSVELIRNLAKRYPHIRLIELSRNKGVLYALNQGIREAKNEFISFMACDDLILPDMYAESADVLMRYPNAPLSVSNPTFWTPESNRVQEKFYEELTAGKCYYAANEVTKIFRQHQYVQTFTGLVRKSALVEAGNYNESYGGHSDWFLWMKMIFKNGVCIIDKPLGLWRISKKSYLHSYIAKKTDHLVALGSMIAEIANGTDEKLYQAFVQTGVLSHFHADAVQAYFLRPDIWSYKTELLIADAMHDWRGQSRRSFGYERRRYWSLDIKGVDVQLIPIKAPRAGVLRKAGRVLLKILGKFRRVWNDL